MLKTRQKKTDRARPRTRRPAPRTRSIPGERHEPALPTHEQIARRAYFIWLEKGKPPHQELTCWCEAEAELRKGPADDA